MQPQISSPFMFNAAKHHAGFLRSMVAEFGKTGINDNQVRIFLLKMGNSMIDLYNGSLSIQHIMDEIKHRLVADGNFAKDRFERFIHDSPAKFQNLMLSDDATWTLLLGNDQERYIHVHPARKSRHTLRVRALALKTALLLKIYCPPMDEMCDLVSQVNDLRCRFLNESPIKNISYTKNLMRVFALI